MPGGSTRPGGWTSDGHGHAGPLGDPRAVRPRSSPASSPSQALSAASETAPAAGPQRATPAADDSQPAAYGDAAYGSGELLGRLDGAGIYNGIKCQPPAAVKGCFPKDRFTIDL